MMMPVRFLADENFDADIIRGLLRRHPSLVCLTVDSCGLRSQPDPIILRYATENGLILLTHDVSTMPGHFSDLLTEDIDSPGVILIHPKTSLSDAIEALSLIWQAGTSDDWRNQLTFLPWS